MNSAHDNERVAVETALRGLRPGAGCLDRDAVMFEAGRASVKRGGTIWPSVLGLLVVVALSAGFAMGYAVSPRGNDGSSVVRAPAIANEGEEPAGEDESVGELLAQAEADGMSEVRLEYRREYVSMCRKVLEEGVAAIPEAKPVQPAEPLGSLFDSVF